MQFCLWIWNRKVCNHRISRICFEIPTKAGFSLWVAAGNWLELHDATGINRFCSSLCSKTSPCIGYTFFLKKLYRSKSSKLQSELKMNLSKINQITYKNYTSLCSVLISWHPDFRFYFSEFLNSLFIYHFYIWLHFYIWIIRWEEKRTSLK